MVSAQQNRCGLTRKQKSNNSQNGDKVSGNLRTVAGSDVREPVVVDIGTVHSIEARHLLAFRNRAGVADVRVQEAARVVML